MKATFTALICCISSMCLGQLSVDYPYNPDADQDSAVGAVDLLELLTLFGAEFEINGIYLDNLSLEDFLSQVNELLISQQQQISELQNQLNDLPAGTTIYETNNYFEGGLSPEALGSLVVSSAAAGAPFCIEDANLTELGLVGKNLAGACLPGCFLQCADDDWPTICWGEQEDEEGNWDGFDFSNGNFEGSYWGTSPQEPDYGDFCWSVGSLDLNGSNWQGANLKNAVIGSNGTNFSDADFSGADLRNAHFYGHVNGNFTNANMRGVTHGYGQPNYNDNWHCNNCQFHGADLSYADLRYADLSQSYLAGADLTGALLSPLSGWSCPYTVPDGYACIGGQGNGPIEIFLIDSSGVEPPPAPCANVQFDGYDYSVIRLGEDCWFEENLKTIQFQNSENIDIASNPADWVDANSQSASVIAGDYATENSGYDWITEYGRLYNLAAVLDERNLCPSGYHVANREDLMSLFAEVAASSGDEDDFEDYGDACSYSLDWSLGQLLLSNDDWPDITNCYYMNSPLNGNEFDGFNCLPAGHVQPNGLAVNIGYSSSIWIRDGEGALRWQLSENGHSYCSYSELGTENGQWGSGVRCVQN